MIDYDRPVEASPETLAELWRRFEDDLDSRGLAAYASELGVNPPPEPEGYQGWEIVEAYPNNNFEHGVLYWLGPQEDHADN